MVGVPFGVGVWKSISLGWDSVGGRVLFDVGNGHKV